jgi:hypothetical protein
MHGPRAAGGEAGGGKADRMRRNQRRKAEGITAEDAEEKQNEEGKWSFLRFKPEIVILIQDSLLFPLCVLCG